MASLFNHVRHVFLELGAHRRYLIGYSGGLDSTVLLHMAAELRHITPLLLSAVHVHHGLSPDADRWQEQCKAQCAKWHIDFIERKITLDHAGGSSIEEEARDLRYAVFEHCLNEDDVLLTAHHEDDQAETLLVQLSRGAGVKGMAAMPVIKSFGRGVHARPLLSFSRRQLEDYATEHQLDWIDDESNHDTRLTRNFFRHAILPLLKKRWPTITHTLSRVASHCAESQELLDYFAKIDLEQCQTARPDVISIHALASLTALRQRQVLRYWLSSLGFLLPSTVKLHQLQRDFLTAAPDKLPLIKWGDVELRRFQDQLYVMHPLELLEASSIVWDLKTDCILPGGRLVASRANGQGLKVNSVRVCFREGGERCYIKQMGGHRLLKNLFQEWGVPPWERNRIPLLCQDDTLIAVVGYFADDTFLANDNEEGWIIRFVTC